MSRSSGLFIATILCLSLIAASCSLFRHEQQPKPPPVVNHTATMDLTPGITINGLVELPPGFTPVVGQPPIWTRRAEEIALTGSVQGRTKVLGFSGPGFRHYRLIAADGGPGAPHGKIVGLAASPDGMTLAVVEAEPDRVEIVLRYLISDTGESTVANFEGKFDAAGLTWLSPSMLAVGLSGRPKDSPESMGMIYLIKVVSAISTGEVRLTCAPSALVFSPDGRFAVGTGDQKRPPSLFNIQTGRCRKIAFDDGPIRVLGWGPGDGTFLYSTLAGRDHGAGVFRYKIMDRTTEVIAVSSSAAAYTVGGVVMALGNRELNAKAAASMPDKRVTAQIASFVPGQGTTIVNSLGIPTTPAMLMASTMTYSPVAAQLGIQLFSNQPQGPTRDILAFSVTEHKAFVLASGSARGVAVIGWSPTANQLAIFDGDGVNDALAVLTPPH
jgi:hypothetical protein